MENPLEGRVRKGSPAYNEVYDASRIPTLRVCSNRYCGWTWSEEHKQWTWTHRGCQHKQSLERLEAALRLLGKDLMAQLD